MKQQRGMNYIMIAQAIIPLFTGLFPISTMFVCTTFRWTFIEVGFISSLLMSWMPTVSPLCYLVFVNSFRRKILKVFIKPKSGTAVAVGTITELMERPT